MFARKTYKPIQNRAIDSKGRIDVSREELEDFQRQFGKHLTLRDLLNYDRTQRLPAAPKSEDDQRSRGRRAEKPKSEDDQRARGTQEANIRPKSEDDQRARGTQEANIRPKSEDDQRAGRPVVKTGAKSAAERVGETTLASRAEAAERRAMEAVDRQRAERAEQMRQADLMRPGRDAITPTLGPEMGLAGLGRAALGALGSRVMGMMTRRGESKEAQREAAEKARDEVRERMRIDDEPKPSVFRSNRPPKDDIPTLRDAVEYKKGGTTKAYAKGGTTKAYAKGGSVRGAGCETRSKKTRYV